MTSEHWQRRESLSRGLKLEERRRAAFLEEACGGDAELRGEVESFLAADAQAEDFTESPALELC